jgi:type IV pilus assembly protein PilQ
VLIEARIVEANKTFARDLGVRLGVGGAFGPIVGYTEDGAPVRRTTVGGALGSTRTMAGQVAGVPTTEANPAGLNLNLPAGASNPGLLSMVLWNNSATRFLNLELSALDVDGRGRLVSSPRVLTANQVEALIEQGTEIPYEEATSSGSTSVTFKKAVLSLKVKPQITPDGRLQLTIEVNKDSATLRSRRLLGVPAIETKKVKSEVLIENGGTVVIGGIYEEEESTGDSARSRCLGTCRCSATSSSRRLPRVRPQGAPRLHHSSHRLRRAHAALSPALLLIQSAGRASGMDARPFSSGFPASHA